MNKDEAGQDKEVKKDDDGVPIDAVKSLVEDFKKSVEAVASRPVNVTVEQQSAPVDTKAAEAEAAAAYNAVREQMNELATAGDTAGAVELMVQHIQSQGSSAQQIDPATHPAYKSLMSMSEKLAKQTYAKEFDKYGDELRDFVKAQPADAQISSDIWEDAVGAIRTRHFDDFLQDAIAEREKPAPIGGPPIARGNTGGRNLDAEEQDELTEDEIGVAKSFGMTTEQYNAQKATIDKTRKRDHFLLLEEETPRTIEPGKF